MPEFWFNVFDGIHSDIRHLANRYPLLNVVDKEIEYLRVIMIKVGKPRQFSLNFTFAMIKPGRIELGCCSITGMIHYHVENYFYPFDFTSVNKSSKGEIEGELAGLPD